MTKFRPQQPATNITNITSLRPGNSVQITPLFNRRKECFRSNARKSLKTTGSVGVFGGPTTSPASFPDREKVFRAHSSTI